MTKFAELSRLPKNGEPCAMVKAYYEHILQLGTLATFLEGFDFESRDEIQRAVIDLHYTIYGDPFMSNKKKRDNDPMLAMLYIKAEKLLVNEGRLDKLAVTLSGDLWHKFFAPRIKRERFERMFSVTPDIDRFAEVSQRIMMVYGLDYTDIEKLRFFVEMVKARDNFPPSLRRMLYIWGKTKKTGKTTCAKMLVATLNGSDDWQNTDPDYTTTLANEMQIGGFKVPKIASCYCCMMDECFYADMGKTYHDFKRFLTSSGGSARLPYGQEFQWTGFPNYVATSNEPLKTFIKDWNDRRFLSVEFKTQPTEALDFPAIHDLWRDFVLNSTPREGLGWQEWSEQIAAYSDEEGERQTLSTEYAIEMRKPEFLNKLLNMVDGKSATSPDNQISLKFFVDHFASTEGYAVSGHRREIEQAVTDVFGERWNGYKYWRLDLLRQQAAMMMTQVNPDNTTFFSTSHEECPY